MAEPPVGCARFTTGLGAATIAPLVLAPWLARSNGGRTSSVLGVLVVVAYAGHIAVTGWLCTIPDVRATARDRPARLVVVPVALVAVAASLGVFVPAQLVRGLLLGFFAWQFSHFQRQNLGLVKLVARKWSAKPLSSTAERLVVIAGWCGIAGLIARPPLLGLVGIAPPLVQTDLVVGIAATAFAMCLVAAVIEVLRNRRPAAVSAAYLLAASFMAPVFLFHRAQAAVTGMVIAHGLQYLWVVRWRRRETRSAASVAGWRTAIAFIATAVLGGSLLEAMSGLHSAHAAVPRGLYGVYLGIVMAHFAIDAVVWRQPARRVASGRRHPQLTSFAYGRQ